MGFDEARHLLNRTGFGASPGEIAEFSMLTREQAVERLLRPARTVAAQPVPAWVNEAITPPRQLRDAGESARKAFQQEQVRRGFELRGWWLAEMIVTPSPLVERMTLFWHNHFVSSQQKVRYVQLMYRQNLLLRQHALGNFAALLHAAAKDPAMILYLDSASNRKGQPNENFAREVMELFTMGEGQYGEADIREAARAFTGWSIEPETGEVLPSGQVGLLEIKGANIFMGYLDAEQSAKAMTPDGWYRTGDLGRMDDDGFLHLAGRLSRFSKIGGEMVPHGTVEDALRKVMGLTDSGEVKVAVASTADPAKGEQLVVLHVDDIDAEAIRTALAAEGLANLWIPKVFKKVPAIPILGTGKLDLNKLRELAQG